jgi:hypothetical protein
VLLYACSDLTRPDYFFSSTSVLFALATYLLIGITPLQVLHIQPPARTRRRSRSCSGRGLPCAGQCKNARALLARQVFQLANPISQHQATPPPNHLTTNTPTPHRRPRWPINFRTAGTGCENCSSLFIFATAPLAGECGSGGAGGGGGGGGGGLRSCAGAPACGGLKRAPATGLAGRARSPGPGIWFLLKTHRPEAKTTNKSFFFSGRGVFSRALALAIAHSTSRQSLRPSSLKTGS